MNNSKSRVIALLLVIPLLLIFVMTSVVETTQIIVDIPVSSVEILGDKIVDIDLANQSNLYQIQTVITPQNASNQNISYSASAVDGKTEANVKITNDGKVVALSLGSVIVTATAGNGRQDRIQLNFTMDAVSAVQQLVFDLPIDVGERVQLTNPQYLATSGTINDATWTSNQPTIASVDNMGVVKGEKASEDTVLVSGKIVGKAIDNQTGDVSDHTYNVAYNVKVNGVTDATTGITWTSTATKMDNGLYVKPTLDKAVFEFTIASEQLTEYGGADNIVAVVDEENQQGIESANIVHVGNDFKLDVTLKADVKIGEKYAVQICSVTKSPKSARRALATTSTTDTGYITTVYVQKGYYTQAEIKSVRPAILFDSFSSSFVSLEHDFIEGVQIKYCSDAPEVLSIVGNLDNNRITAKSVGNANIWAEILAGDTKIGETDSIKIDVVDPVTKIDFLEATESLGLENLKTIADREVEFNALDEDNFTNYKFYESDYLLVPTSYTLAVKIGSRKSGADAQASDVVWKCVDANGNNGEHIAKIVTKTDESGTSYLVEIVGTGEVTIIAESAHNDALGQNTKGQITLRCLKNSLWVDDYYDLMFAMDVAKKSTDQNLTDKTPIVDAVVLRSDVMLAPVLENNSFKDYRNYLSTCATKTMATTMDFTYYQDIGRQDDAQIRYCVDVNKNIYGNGKYICGEYISNSYARLGFELFRGPLDLVSTTENQQNTEKASVKAQDNVVFMVNTPNVTICNVELKGCADETLYGGKADGEANLANFNNVGTVLEVVEDGCQLTYSRVKNGRTVVRIFGKAYSGELDPQTRTPAQQVAYLQENINDFRTATTISNCILSHGREFILKISSNQIIKNVDVKTKSDNEQPYTESELGNITNLASPFLCGDITNGKHNLCKAGSHNYYKTSGEEYKATQEWYTDIGGMYTGQSQHKQDVDNFYNNYVLTDVILRDSAFSDSGLFCIGFESRFAGSLLFGNDGIFGAVFNLAGWNRVAGASMPSRLKMEGNVRFYDWKVLDNVNAESLIEVSEKFTYREYLNLNIQKMVEDYQSGMLAQEKNTFVNLLDFSEGKNYINGSTAFYGGGKNYSYIDASEVNSDFVPLSEYRVSMNYFPRSEFITAAGKEPFRFYMYNSQSSLNKDKQDQLIAGNKAYSWLYRTNN